MDEMFAVADGHSIAGEFEDENYPAVGMPGNSGWRVFSLLFLHFSHLRNSHPSHHLALLYRFDQPGTHRAAHYCNPHD